MANNRFSASRLWNSYSLISPKEVRKHTTKEEQSAMTNIIQLVRFAFKQIKCLDSLVSTSKQYFNLWLGQKQRQLTEKQRDVLSEIVDYIATNGASSVGDIRQDDATKAAQIIYAFGNNIAAANEALISLYSFVVLRNVA